MKQIPRIALVACLWPGIGQAQDTGPGGLSFTLGLNQRVEASSDADLATAGADRGVDGTTTLSFGAVTETRAERLALDLGLGLRLSDGGVMRGDSRAALSYARTSADAELSLSADWARTDISFLRDTSDFINADGVLVLPDDLDELTATGTRTTTDLAATLRWGDTAPLGYSLGLSHRVLRYDDTATASLTDSATSAVTGGLRLTLSPVATANLSLRHSRTEEPGSPMTDSTTLSGDLTLDRPLGDLTARFSATRDAESDTFWAASVSRDLDLPGAGLSAMLGLAEDDTGTPQVTGRLALRYDLPEGRIDLSAAHSLAAGSDQRTTTLQASYAQALTPLSTLRLGFDYAHARDLDGPADLATGSLTASYGMQLTPDWDLSLGARADLRDDAGDRSRGNTLFVTLDRSLTWRP